MMDSNPNRKRNTYLVLIAAGIILLVEQFFGVATVIAGLLIYVGIQNVRSGLGRRGTIFLVIGTLILVGQQLHVIIALILLSLGYFYIKTKQIQQEGTYVKKHSLLESLKHDKEPWVARNMGLWCIIGEIRLDFTLALFENEETTLFLQGIIGDIDLIIPEDLGVSVQSSVLFGQMNVAMEREAGLLNKIFWESPQYATSSQKVRLIVSFAVGDVTIKTL